MNKSHDGLDARAVLIRLHATGGPNTALSVTMPAVPGWVNVLDGYDYTGNGATVGTTVDISCGLGGILRKMEVPASPLAVARDTWRPPRPIAAVNPNTTVTVTVPALGAGNTSGQLTVYGYRIKSSG